MLLKLVGQVGAVQSKELSVSGASSIGREV